MQNTKKSHNNYIITITKVTSTINTQRQPSKDMKLLDRNANILRINQSSLIKPPPEYSIASV